MNRRQQLVQQAFLGNEEAVIQQLEKIYDSAYKDIIKKAKDLQNQISELDVMMKLATDEADRAVLQSMQQSKIYQKQYQDALKKQIGGILDNLQVEEFKTVAAYLKQCYEDGFIGTMFDLQGQGIPLCFPLDQAAMVRAVQLDSKISEGLYKHLGEDISDLKKAITSEVSRGISTGASFSEVAQQIKFRMSGTYDNSGGSLAYAMRIARTEGHRIQVQSAMDACYKAKDAGADVVKQWDSTLDKRTRRSHQHVDGEIRELDEPFSNGLMFPGDPAGGAKEVVNCRCALLQRARWALDDDELETLKERAKYFKLDKSKTFDDYKSKYLKAADDIAKPTGKPDGFIPAKDMKEAKTRFSNALGIPEDDINLGRMKPELANQYLEGVERFMNDYPMLSGFYDSLGTKTKGANVLGLNAMVGKPSPTDKSKYLCSIDLHFKNPKDYDKMMENIKYSIKKGHSFENESPFSTAIHELVHGIDHATGMKKNGFYDDDYRVRVIDSKDWRKFAASVAHEIVQQARQELFGKQHGKDVYEGISYLGSYALTNSQETLAQAISWEYVNESRPYSAKIKELFDKKVKEVFGL